jgi:hypothetical protein
MVLQISISLRQIDFGFFSLGHRKEIYPRNICPGYYVLDNGVSYSRLPSDVYQVVRLFCHVILILVLMPMLINYFNGCARARSLGIAAQKIMENRRWYLQVYGFVSILSCLQKNTRFCHGRRKSLKTLKIC